MKESLENKIKSNLPYFEEEPEQGHEMRFAAKLEINHSGKGDNKLNIRKLTITLTSIAAIFALGIFFIPSLQTKSDVCVDELCEVQQFYRQQMLDKMDELNDMINQKPRLLDKDLKQEINQISDDKMLNHLTNMTEEEKIAFTVNYYQIKLETLNHIEGIIKNI
ncbi:MAG: hypothetical protein LBM07_03520 [Culturomica sp.]|jgi:hypothetical protein|nr:hypothetical protein [Culturomica sp.]